MIVRLPLLLTLAPALLPLASCGGESASVDGRKGVILVSLDTLRADRLGCYGYERETSRFLDSLAREGVLFEDLMAPSSKTASSHMSMFSGMHPGVHGVHNYYDTEATAASDELPLLPELLQSAGYHTAAITGGGMLLPDLGFGRGFHYVDDRGGGGDRVFRRATDWMRNALPELDADEPFFLFVHTYEIHDPYTPPAEWQQKFVQPGYSGRVDATRVELPVEDDAATSLGFFQNIQKSFWGGFRKDRPEDVQYVSDLYDAGIAYTDDLFSEFWSVVEELGLDDDVILIVTSDHGEELVDHGETSHRSIYQEVLHVPLIVRTPETAARGAGHRVGRLVQGIDLLPSVLELAGAEAPSGIQGRSWVADLDPAGAGDEHALGWAELAKPKSDLAAVRVGDLKLIDRTNVGRGELYDLEADPGETQNENQTRPEDSEQLGRLMRRQRAENKELSERFPPVPVVLSADALEDMSRLGYVGDEE